ncbi:Swi SNf2 RAD26 [Cryptosporidium bovis]|uniref:Swi SNf2 RAD26 n=1 Tax=Cryptosporidium bovis TaxID=310047 RepID=UPI00351A6AED|nr:Swi SNf2 RAD26 [Cryptosporidium bovis]
MIKEEEGNLKISNHLNTNNDASTHDENDSGDHIVSYYEEQNILDSYFDKKEADNLRNLGVSLVDAKDVSNTILEQINTQYSTKISDKVGKKTNNQSKNLKISLVDPSSSYLNNSYLSQNSVSNETVSVKQDVQETFETVSSDSNKSTNFNSNERFEVRDDSDEIVYYNRTKSENEKNKADENKTILITHELNRNKLFIWEKIWKSLYYHQREGVLWMWDLHCNNHGGILADEMGLGKSVTVAAFVAAICITCKKNACNGDTNKSIACVLKQERNSNPVNKLEESDLGYPSVSARVKNEKDRIVNFDYKDEFELSENGSRRFLLVLPATLISHWIEVFNNWYYPIRVFLLHGRGENSINVQLEKISNKGNTEYDILVITTYETLRRNLCLFKRVNWFYVILDEGHKIRNPDSGITLAVKSIGTCNRLLLSGSPIQNDLKELWSLIDFVYPGRLGTLPIFEQQFVIPIKQAEFRNAMKAQKMRAFNCTKILQELIKSCILRRRKHELQSILNLPSQAEHVLFCTLTSVQYDVYCNCLDLLQANQLIKNKMYGITKYFALLNILRETCNHPELLKLIKKSDKIDKKRSKKRENSDRDEYVDDESDFESDEFEFVAEEGVFEANNHNEHDSNSVDKSYDLFSKVNGDDSGKYQALLSILKLWRNNGQHRVLIFTQGVRTLKLLSRMLERDMNLKLGKDLLNLDGSTPLNVRFSLVKKFNQDTSIFLFILTSRVGGVGLNITGANRVILYDPWWNPMTDVQAKERCWRIGQKREVIVYRLITKDTIEERIFQRQLFKEFIAKQILMDPKSSAKLNLNNLSDLVSKPKKPNNYNSNSKLVSYYLKNIKRIWGNKAHFRKDGNTYFSYFDKPITESHTYFQYESHKKKYINDELNLFGEITCDAKSEHNAIMNILGGNGTDNYLTNDIGSSSFVEEYGEEGISLMNNIFEVTEDLAKQSLEAINQSKIEISNYNCGIPTWTGKSGQAGAPSSFILKNLKRQRTALSCMYNKGIQEQLDCYSPSNKQNEHINNNSLETKWDEEFIRKRLIDYFIKREKLGIRTTTENILKSFGEVIPDSNHLLFKKILKQICVLIRSDINSVNENIWVLKKNISLL